MPNPESGATQAQTPGTPATPPSSAPQAGESSNPNRPAWAQGKSLDEVIALTEGLIQGAYAPSPQQQPQYNAPPQQAPVGPPDPNLIYSDPARYQRELDAYQSAQFNTRLSQVAAPFAQQQSALAARQAELDKHESKRDPRYADAWKRWEPEIEMELRGIPAEQRNLALFNKAAAIVKANHIDEILGEAREQMLASAPGMGTERGSSSGGMYAAPTADKLDEAWESGHPYFVKAQQEGVTKAQLREWCAKRKTTVDDFVQSILGETLIVTPAGFQRSTV